MLRVLLPRLGALKRVRLTVDGIVESGPYGRGLYPADEARDSAALDLPGSGVRALTAAVVGAGMGLAAAYFGSAAVGVAPRAPLDRAIVAGWGLLLGACTGAGAGLLDAALRAWPRPVRAGTAAALAALAGAVVGAAAIPFVAERAWIPPLGSAVAAVALLALLRRFPR